VSEKEETLDLTGSRNREAKPVPAAPSVSRRRRAAGALAWALFLGLGGWFGYEAVTWPDVSLLARQNPETFMAVEYYEAHDRPTEEIPHARWQWVAYDRISPNLKRAVLVAEDINFFSHHGFDPAEIAAAVKDGVEEFKFPRGASTLSQQLARLMWLPPTKSPVRKFKEMLLTIQLERRLTKKRIFELYLNVAQFGPGLFGAEAASRFYFNRPAADLDETQAAQLAAGLSRVTFWNPASTAPAYPARVRLLLRRMDKAQFLWKLI
jgi:monofunctional glycosyltransferase